MSCGPFLPIVRAGSAALLLIVAGASTAAAQIPPPDRQLPDLKLRAPAELEIYQQRLYSTRIGQNDELKIVVGARNNGELAGSFDFALGPASMDKVWWRSAGTTLDSGGKTLGNFQVSWAALMKELGYGPQGWHKVCLGLYLVKKGSTDVWVDPNNPNHRKSVCFEMYRLTG